jgi:hypothetical protein
MKSYSAECKYGIEKCWFVAQFVFEDVARFSVSVCSICFPNQDQNQHLRRESTTCTNHDARSSKESPTSHFAARWRTAARSLAVLESSVPASPLPDPEPSRNPFDPASGPLSSAAETLPSRCAARRAEALRAAGWR